MSQYTPRPGALAATTVTQRVQARYPWIMLPSGKPLEIELEPGDSFVLDEPRRFFQFRKTASDGTVRTVTPEIDFWLKRSMAEIEMELRTGPTLGEGPEVIMTKRELIFDEQGHDVSRAVMFQRFCEALNSPVWNPFGPVPTQTVIGSYRVNFQIGEMSFSDGSSAEPVTSADLPHEMTLRVNGDLVGKHKNDGDPTAIVPGEYRARPECLEENATGSTHLRLDGHGTDGQLYDKMYVTLGNFMRAKEQGAVQVLAIKEGQAFAMGNDSL